MKKTYTLKKQEQFIVVTCDQTGNSLISDDFVGNPGDPFVMVRGDNKTKSVNDSLGLFNLVFRGRLRKDGKYQQDFITKVSFNG
jgi:hypothetical protein